MSGRGRRGRPKRVIPEVFERPAVPKRDEHVVGSTTASMNQPPAPGQAGPSRPPKGAQVPGLFTAEQVEQIYQIVAIATRQQSQPPPPPREVLEEPVRSIERVQKLGAKPYDGSGDPEATWLWLDRVNKVYGVTGCTDEQRVLFSSFVMEDRAKDCGMPWIGGILMVYHGTNFNKNLLTYSFLKVTRIRRLRSSSC